MVKAVIFDMDGLLIDSEPHWRKSHIEVLGNYGFVVTEEDARAAAGRRTGDQIKLWQERFGWQEPKDEVITQQIVENVIQLIHLHGEALPGVYHIVELLRAHDVPMAVASSSTTGLIRVVLEKLQLQKYMVSTHSGEDEKRGKPFPDVFLTTAKQLGVAPEDCLVFEDSINGVAAAKAANMKCIAVPEHPHDPAQFVTADRVVPSLEAVDWQFITSL